VLVSSIIKNPEISATDGGKLTYRAFQQIPYIGTPILVIGIVAFAYSTVLGWSYYGERCVEYLFGRKGMIPYKILFLLVLLISPVIALDMVWTLSDISNALMAIPNLIAVLLLSGVVVKETNYYLYGNRLNEYDKSPIPVVDK
jgi:AGCS family alanine or glycine:cation symporter